MTSQPRAGASRCHAPDRRLRTQKEVRAHTRPTTNHERVSRALDRKNLRAQQHTLLSHGGPRVQEYELLHEQGMPLGRCTKEPCDEQASAGRRASQRRLKNTRPAQSTRPESGEGVGALGFGALGLGALTTSSKVLFSSRVNMPASRAWGPAMGRGRVERAGKLQGECTGGGPPAGGAHMRSEAL